MSDDTKATAAPRYYGAGAPPPQKPKRRAPLWRRVVTGLVQAGLAVFLLFHLYLLALKFLPVPGTILMMQRAMQGEDVQRDWMSLGNISPHLVLAVIASEDTKFCEHGGIDWEAIEKAREFNRKNKGERRRGGSTISQQTAKNIFFWNGGGMPRKAGEAWMTYVIETVWGKRRIMEVYLNVAEWGDGLFGAEAAAQARFGKSAADLSPAEGARLAAVLPSPNKWSADKPGPYVRKRAATIQSRMRVVADQGYAACILGDDFRPALPKPEKGASPRPPPVLEDLPDAPDEGEEAPGLPSETAPEEENANDVLNDILNSADETFNTQPLPEPATEMQAEMPAEMPSEMPGEMPDETPSPEDAPAGPDPAGLFMDEDGPAAAAPE